jgi:hypothetical protein
MKVSVQRSQIRRFMVDIVNEKRNIADTKDVLEFKVDVE